jgi:hypothetical protein
MLLRSVDAMSSSEAFAAARAATIHFSREIPSTRTDFQDPGARVALSIEWTRRPAYAVVALSARLSRQ